jgi:hypothetical protein
MQCHGADVQSVDDSYNIQLFQEWLQADSNTLMPKGALCVTLFKFNYNELMEGS